MPRKTKAEMKKDLETLQIALALKELAKEKGLSNDVVVEAMGEALKKAYFKYSGDYSDSIINVNIDLDTGVITMAKVKRVVAEIQDDVFETDPEEAYEETGIKYVVGDTIETPIDISLFRRAAAMQAKSVFKQKLREAEKKVVVDNFASKVGTVLTGIVSTVESKHCLIKLQNSTSAYLNISEMIPNPKSPTKFEQLVIGAPICVYVKEVDKQAGGAPVIVSRRDPHLVTALMQNEIQDIRNGVVEIRGISRLAGVRSKVSVSSKDPNIDPSGACIGRGGSNLTGITKKICDEKIDIINYNENPLLYVADALKPATVIGVAMIEENKVRAIVDDNQFSLAIGANATNVTLAVKLTNINIDIKTLSEAKEQGYEYQDVEELRFMDEAKRRANVTATTRTPVTPVTPVTKPSVVEQTTYSFEETPSIDTTPVVPKTTKEVKEEVKPVEEKVVVKPTRSSTRNVFSELEAALNATGSSETSQTTKKKYKKNDDKNDEEEVKEEKPEIKKATPSNVLPVYTEEELRAIEEEEAAEEAGRYDDEDIDYDEFDSYYDEED